MLKCCMAALLVVGAFGCSTVPTRSALTNQVLDDSISFFVRETAFFDESTHDAVLAHLRTLREMPAHARPQSELAHCELDVAYDKHGGLVLALRGAAITRASQFNYAVVRVPGSPNPFYIDIDKRHRQKHFLIIEPELGDPAREIAVLGFGGNTPLPKFLADALLVDAGRHTTVTLGTWERAIGTGPVTLFDERAEYYPWSRKAWPDRVDASIEMLRNKGDQHRFVRTIEVLQSLRKSPPKNPVISNAIVTITRKGALSVSGTWVGDRPRRATVLLTDGKHCASIKDVTIDWGDLGASMGSAAHDDEAWYSFSGSVDLATDDLMWLGAASLILSLADGTCAVSPVELIDKREDNAIGSASNQAGGHARPTAIAFLPHRRSQWQSSDR